MSRCNYARNESAIERYDEWQFLIGSSGIVGRLALMAYLLGNDLQYRQEYGGNFNGA